MWRENGTPQQSRVTGYVKMMPDHFLAGQKKILIGSPLVMLQVVKYNMHAFLLILSALLVTKITLVIIYFTTKLNHHIERKLMHYLMQNTLISYVLLSQALADPWGALGANAPPVEIWERHSL